MFRYVPIFVNLCIIRAFAATHVGNKIFSNFGLLLGPRRIMHACLDPTISCSSSTNGSIVVFSANKVGNKKWFSLTFILVLYDKENPRVVVKPLEGH